MAEPTSTSTSKGPPQLEEGEIGEAEKDSQSVKPANKTYSIHDNPLINDQPENEPRVYASAKARKVMARAQRLALIARQPKEPRQADSHNAHEGRALSEPRESNRPNQLRRRHSGRRRGDNLPLHRRTRARTDFPAGTDENRNENFDQPSNNQGFTDYNKRERQRHHVPPQLDRPNDQQANDTNMPYNHPDHHYDHPVHHYDHAINHRYDHPQAYHEQTHIAYPTQSSSQPPLPPTPHYHHPHPPKLVPNYPPSHYLSYPPAPPAPPLPPPPTQASSFPLQSIPEHEAISHPPFREYEVTYGPPMQAHQAHIPAPPPEAYFPPQAHHEPPVSQHVISNSDVHAENQSSHSEYDPQQQHHAAYQLGSEQQMSREHYPHHHHPHPMVGNRLVPNYPVPPAYDEFQHPPQSSPTLHGFHPRPPSQPGASDPKIHGANQPPYYQGDPEQQRQHGLETASEQPPQEPYSSGPTHPQPFRRARLVPNYPAPADQREFNHPPPFSPSAPGSETFQPPPLPIPRPPSAPLLDRQRYAAKHHHNSDSRRLRGASESAPPNAGAFPGDAYHHRGQIQGAPPRPDEPAPVTPRHPEQSRFPPQNSGNVDRRPTEMDNGGEEQWASKEEEYQAKLKEANKLMAEVISMGITVEFLRSIGISERCVRGTYPATYAELEAGGSGSHLAHNNGEK